MRELNAKIKAFLLDEEGLATVEYAVAGSLVALAAVIAFTNLGLRVNNAITALGNAIGN